MSCVKDVIKIKIDVLLTRILRKMLPTLPFLRQSYRSLGSIATTRRRVNHNAVRSLDRFSEIDDSQLPAQIVLS